MTTTAEPGTAGEAGHHMVLSDAHLRELEASCITDQVIAERGYRTLEDTEDNRALLKDLKIPGWAWESEEAWPGLLIPIYRATGEVISHQFKPAVPQMGPGKKPMKYASPRGDAPHLDVPPAARAFVGDVEQPLWVTEGVKKVDCLVSMNKVAIGITGVWNWRKKTGTLGDWEDVPLIGRTVVICYDADTVEKRGVMLGMRRFGKWLESKKVADVRYLIVPGSVEQSDGTAVSVKGVDDYFHASADKAKAMRDLGAHALKALPLDGPKDAAFSDAFLTDTLVDEALADRFVWSPGLGWMGWDGRRWSEATDAELHEAARQWAIDQYRKVLDEEKKDPNRELGQTMEGWRSVLQGSRQRNLVQMARGQLIKPAAEFDAHPDLLNCPNGVVDLRTGELLPSDPDLYLTKMSGAAYHPGATHPDWTSALGAVHEGARDWYQVRMGQAFTGYMTPDDTLVLQLGGGENGKSTVNVPLAEAAGSYYVLVSHRVLMSNPDAHPTELMDFRGTRYAMLEETPDEKRLEPQRIKAVVGTPKITARHIRQDSVTFDATHSLFISTNYLPIVNETDHGTWRRLTLMEYPYTFRKKREDVLRPTDRLGDPTLRDRCAADRKIWEAALAWVVAGAVQWYARGRIMPDQPDSVRKSTLKWRAESDLIMAYIGDRIVFDPKGFVKGPDLLKDFNTWMSDTQGDAAREWTARLFTTRFGGHGEVTLNRVEKGVVRVGPTTQRGWSGLRLRLPSDPFDDGPVNSEEVDSGEPPNKIVTLVTPTSVKSDSPYTRELNPAWCNKRNAQVSESDSPGVSPETAPESPVQPQATAPEAPETPRRRLDPFTGTFDTPVYTEKKLARKAFTDDDAADFLGTTDVPAPRTEPSPLQQWNDAVEGFFAGRDPQTETTDRQTDDDFFANPWGDE